jgi:hypothetical protein
MLIIHEALHFGDRQESTLLNSNQLRANGLIVEDVPRQYDLNSLHLIVAPKAGVTIPLSIRGVISGFDTVMEEYYDVDSYPDPVP